LGRGRKKESRFYMFFYWRSADVVALLLDWLVWCVKTPYVLTAITKFSFICLLSDFVVVTKAIVQMYHKNVELTGSASAGNRLVNQTLPPRPSRTLKGQTADAKNLIPEALLIYGQEPREPRSSHLDHGFSPSWRSCGTIPKNERLCRFYIAQTESSENALLECQWLKKWPDLCFKLFSKRYRVGAASLVKMVVSPRRRYI
jgi:hypothetical protein